MGELNERIAKKNTKKRKLRSITVDKEDILEYDIGNLCAFDSTPVEVNKFKANKEVYLRKLARENTQLLINQIFAIPSEQCATAPGRIIDLPAPTTPIPREKPIPKPRPLTKWQTFAKERGIRKKKRDKIAYDEDSGEWKRTWGYKRANDQQQEWVVEHNEMEHTALDPFTKMSLEKKERIRWNKEKHHANLREASGPQAVPGTIDLMTASQHSRKKGVRHKDKRKQQVDPRRGHLEVGLQIAQSSTASMGKFDRTNKTEKNPKQAKVQTPRFTNS